MSSIFKSCLHRNILRRKAQNWDDITKISVLVSGHPGFPHNGMTKHGRRIHEKPMKCNSKKLQKLESGLRQLA